MVINDCVWFYPNGLDLSIISYAWLQFYLMVENKFFNAGIMACLGLTLYDGENKNVIIHSSNCSGYHQWLLYTYV